MKTVKRIVSIVLCVIMAFSCITCNASAVLNYPYVTVSTENIKFGIGDSISRVFVSFFRGFANQFLSVDEKLLTDIELETKELSENTIRVHACFNDGVEPK